MPGSLEKSISDAGSFLSEASTWIPEWLPSSAWIEHAPFAFWLVETHEPEILIELGTHMGFSFFSFCQAVARLKLSTRAYAVDTWKGDEHAGFYGDEVFQEVSKHNTERYSSFSQLIRSTFDDALPYFEDRSVDLLHIDGRHFYEDVKHDFNSWLPKLSDRGIVLFHDVNVRERSFGVFRYWAELSQRYPHFQFFHGWGLGVLGVGKKLPRPLRALFETEGNSKRANKVRNIYARLGASLDDRSAHRRSAREIELKEAEASALKTQVSTLEAHVANTRSAGEAALSELSDLRSRLSASEVRGTEREAALTLRTGELSAAKTEFADKERQAAQQRAELDTALCETRQKLDSSKLQLAAAEAALTRQHEDAAQQRADLEGRLTEARQQLQSLHAQVSAAKTERDSFEAAVGKVRRELGSTTAQLDAAKAQLDTAKAQLSESAAELARQRGDAARQRAELGAQRAALQERAVAAEASRENLQAEHDGVLNSTFWRVTAPARRLGAVLPQGVRRQTRRGARLLYWALTPHRIATRIAHRRARRESLEKSNTPAWAELFDRNWYLERYPDVAAGADKLDPLRHFIHHGAAERRDPNPFFDTSWYLETNPDVARAGDNALAHYFEHGAAEGRDPSPLFDTSWYLETHGDVAASGTNPLLHYLRHGAAEGRATRAAEPPVPAWSKFFDPCWHLGHYSSRKSLEADYTLLRDSELFDEKAYRATAGIGEEMDAVEHYLVKGWLAGLEPRPDFEGQSLYSYYRSVGYSGPPAITYLKLRAAGAPVFVRLADAENWAAPIRSSDMFDAVGYVARLDDGTGLDPALHYVIVGEHMGFPPSDRFDQKYYLERYPDVARAQSSALGHYVLAGRREGRRPVSIAHDLVLDHSRFDDRRQTILLISHEASRTGAPILAWNVAMRLCRRYNIVTLLIGGGELIENFDKCSAAIVGPVGYAACDPVEAAYIVRLVSASYSIVYAIANSAESRFFVPALASAFIPVVALIHEFASYTHPKGALGEALDWSTQIVFSSDVTADSAKAEYSRLAKRTVHVLPQGQCEIPQRVAKAPSAIVENLRGIFRPRGYEDALVVLGAGFIHIRKGVDLFLACAAAVAALNPMRPVRFIWIGGGYDPDNDPGYSTYLSEQIARSGLEGKVGIIEPIDDLEPAYAMADIFFLSSRLDPLPNVTIDAAFHGLPVVCFENASGIASLLAKDEALRPCVVPHLDINAAACRIAQFADNDEMRAGIGIAMRRLAEATFDMDRYVSRLDELGREAIDLMRQRAEDLVTLRDDPLFDESTYSHPDSPVMAREEAIIHFLAQWAAADCFRRPCAGFHPQIYADANLKNDHTANVNPLAHFVRSGKPDGPWRHEAITPDAGCNSTTRKPQLRCAIHAHFFYPELVQNFLTKLNCNRSRCDLLVSTDSSAKARKLQEALADYERGDVQVRIVPNRGRDIGPLLTALGADITERYDLIGHVHGKRSLVAGSAMGETWREFLWQHLLGDLHPMMDIIVKRFAGDEKLGLVFPCDPYLCNWGDNRGIAEDLARRVGIREMLPPFFDFPVGMMFWMRTDVLRTLSGLRLSWDDYPQEPVPYDGTILHALERLLPFVARRAGYRFATTHVPSVNR